MWVTVLVMAFWFTVVTGGRYLYRAWSTRRYLEPARGLNEILSADYYRQLSNAQFEALVLRTLKERGYTLLGEPWLGRAKEQGYAWRKGKKFLISYRLSRPLTEQQLAEIAKKMRLFKADQVLVFSPLVYQHRQVAPDGVKVFSGNKLVRWFSILDMAPPIATHIPEEACECGSTLRERVSRAGQPLLVCSMYPDCRVMRRPEQLPTPTLRIEPGSPALTA